MANAETLLGRLGYNYNNPAPQWIADLAYALYPYVQSGQMSEDEALVNLRAQVEGRNVGSYSGSAGTGLVTNTGGTSGGSGGISIPLVIQTLTPLLGAQGAIDFATTDPEGALALTMKILGKSGFVSSGGTGRTLFPHEQRLGELQAQELEQRLGLIGQGASRFQNVGGYMFDPLTGELVDPTSLGVSRFNADTGRLGALTERDLAQFTMGPQFQEGQRQFNERLGLDRDRLGLDALGEERLAKSAAAQAEIGFGNLGVDRANFVRQVLSSPSDTLARLYMQRGGTSPTAKIEMADLLNSFNRQAQNISQATSRFMPSNTIKTQPTGPMGAVVPPLPATKPPTQTPTQATAPAVTSDIPPYLSPAYDPWAPDTQARWDQGIEEGSIVLADPAATPSNYTYDPNGGVDSTDQYNFEIRDGNLIAVPQMDQGGYTKESRFIVGDQRSGRPTGHEEMVVNPTKAPIMVISNKDLKGMSRLMGSMPRYEEGTDSFGDLRKPSRLNANPTGGFLNSLLESLGIDRAQNLATTQEQLAEVQSPEGMEQLQDIGTAMGSFSGPRLTQPRFDLKNIPDDWGPNEFRKFSQNIKMDNLNTLKSMIDNAMERASRFDKMATTAVGDKGMRLSRLADKAFKRVDDLFQYERELQEDILHNARQKSYQEVDFIEPGKPGQAMKEALGQSVSQHRGLGSAPLNTAQLEDMVTYTPSSPDEARAILKELDEAERYANGDQYESIYQIRENLKEWLDINGLPGFAGGTSRLKRYADGTLFPTYNDSHSLFPTGNVTQQQLVDMSRIATGPGGNSVLSGTMPDRFRIPGLQTPTAMQFNSLSGAERENLRPRLAAEFNSTLEDLMFDIEQRYSTGPSRLAKFRG